MKKIITTLLALLILLAISWCGKTDTVTQSPENTTNQEQSTDSDSSDNNSNWVKYSRSDCIRWCETLWKSNEKNKDKPKEEMDKECNSICDAWQWIQNDDPSSCEKAEWIMRNGCFGAIAKKRKDVAICDKIDEKMLLNGCYADIAKELKDNSICQKIQDKMWKEICEEWVKEKN